MLDAICGATLGRVFQSEIRALKPRQKLALQVQMDVTWNGVRENDTSNAGICITGYQLKEWCSSEYIVLVCGFQVSEK